MKVLTRLLLLLALLAALPGLAATMQSPEQVIQSYISAANSAASLTEVARFYAGDTAIPTFDDSAHEHAFKAWFQARKAAVPTAVTVTKKIAKGKEWTVYVTATKLHPEMKIDMQARGAVALKGKFVMKPHGASWLIADEYWQCTDAQGGVVSETGHDPDTPPGYRHPRVTPKRQNAQANKDTHVNTASNGSDDPLHKVAGKTPEECIEKFLANVATAHSIYDLSGFSGLSSDTQLIQHFGLGPAKLAKSAVANLREYVPTHVEITSRKQIDRYLLVSVKGSKPGAANKPDATITGQIALYERPDHLWLVDYHLWKRTGSNGTVSQYGLHGLERIDENLETILRRDTGQ